MATLAALGVFVLGVILAIVFFVNDNYLLGFVAICAAFPVSLGVWISMRDRL